jgi:hypothetical protein
MSTYLSYENGFEENVSLLDGIPEVDLVGDWTQEEGFGAEMAMFGDGEVM